MTAVATPSAPATRPGRVRLEAFDTLRLLCALHIMAYHLLEHPLVLLDWPDWLVAALTSTAGISTSIFFLLSGFVIAYAHTGEKMFNPLKPMGRSYPLFTLVMIAWYLGLEVFDRPDSPDFIRSLLLLEPFTGKFPVDPCVPAWAMTTFYLGYLMNAAMVPRLSALSVRRLRVWLGIVLATLFLRGAISARLMPNLPPYPEHTWNEYQDFLHIFPPLRLGDILCGTLCGAIVAKEASTDGATAKSHRWRWEATVVGIWLLCATIGLVSGPLGFGGTHGLLMAPLAVWILNARESVGGIFHTIGPWIRKHANVSLEMYVFHTFVAALVYKFANKHFGSETPDAEIAWALTAFILAVPVAFLMAAAMTRLQRATAWACGKIAGNAGV